MAMVDYHIIEISDCDVVNITPLVIEAIGIAKAKGTSIKQLHQIAADCIDYGISLAAVADGNIVAILFMRKNYVTGSTTICALHDDMFYVKKEYRASGIAKELVDTAIAIAKLDEDVHHIYFASVNAHSDAERVGWEGLMKTCGLGEVGKIYSIEV